MAEKSFNRVGVNDALDVLPNVVPDTVMLLKLPADLAVQQRLIGHQVGFVVNILVQGLADVDIRQLPATDSVNLPAALHHSDDRRFIAHLLVHRATRPDVRLIGLYNSGKKLFFLLLEKLSDLLCHAPSSLIRYAKLTLKLHRRNTVAGISEKEDGEEPTFEGRIRFVENRATKRMNLVAAVLADVAFAVLQPVEPGFFLTPAIGADF